MSPYAPQSRRGARAASALTESVGASPVSADGVAESEALTGIARRLAGAGGDLAACLDLLTSGAVTLLSSEGAVAARIVGHEFRVEAASGSLVPLIGFHAPVAGSLAMEATDRGSPVLVNDPSGDARVEAHFLSAFGLRHVVVAPMMVEYTGRGFLLAINSGRGAFSSSDAAVLQRLADHGGVAVRHAELVERLRDEANQARTLCDIVQEIHQSLELERVQVLLARRSAELLHARTARVALLDGGHLVIVAAFGDESAAVGTPVDPGRVFAGQALRLSRAQRTSDIRAYADVREPAPFGEGEGGACRPNAVVAPLLVGSRAIGAVTVSGNDRRDFTEQDESLLMALANQAAVAIENARLYRAAAATARRANTIAASARSLAFSATPEQVYAGISAVARTELDAEGFTVVLADAGRGEGPGELTLAYTEGAGKAIQWTAERFWRLAPGQVARSGVPQYLTSIESVYNDLTAEEAAAFRAASVHSLAMLPLHIEGTQRGILILRFAQARRFDEPDRHLMEDFATQVTLAIRNAQLIAAERTGRERERVLADTMHQTEKLAALGELVAGVAHELNNPLTGISTFAQLLMEEQLNEEQLEAVLTIKREADRAGSVIRDLLAFSRKTGPRDVVVDLNLLVQQTLRMRGYALQTAGIQVVAQLDQALPQISGDDQKLQQVLLNLVVNAEHAMHRQSERRLTVRSMSDLVGPTPRAIVEISDTGTGIAPDLMKHIFEPFFTTKPAGVGTGLGLSVSYGIVQAHGGTISARSAPGEGSTFVIALPLSSGGASAAAKVTHGR